MCRVGYRISDRPLEKPRSVCTSAANEIFAHTKEQALVYTLTVAVNAALRQPRTVRAEKLPGKQWMLNWVRHNECLAKLSLGVIAICVLASWPPFAQGQQARRGQQRRQ